MARQSFEAQAEIVRRAARTDANQAAIVAAMQAAGASVWVIGLPVDLLVGAGGNTALVEVKTLVGKRSPKAAPYTKLQTDFMASWRGGAIATITDVESAVRLVTLLKTF